MTTEPTPAAAPAANAEQTPAQVATNTTPQPQAGEGSESISLEEAKKLRSEAQSLRKRMKAYEDAEKAAQEAALSEAEKSAKRAQEAEARIKQYQDQLVTAQVKLAAQEKGIIDPELAALAVQKTLELDDDGMPTNLDEALDALIKNKPYLVPASSVPEQPATPAQPGQAPALPAMNPGRNVITQQSPLPQGKPIGFHDIEWKR